MTDISETLCSFYLKLALFWLGITNYSNYDTFYTKLMHVRILAPCNETNKFKIYGNTYFPKIWQIRLSLLLVSAKIWWKYRCFQFSGIKTVSSHSTNQLRIVIRNKSGTWRCRPIVVKRFSNYHPIVFYNYWVQGFQYKLSMICLLLICI